MGMNIVVEYDGPPPPWEAIRAELARNSLVASIKMIDGLPAFPDEEPEAGWRELRLGFPAGMVTIRRGLDRDECVTWGNADAALNEAWKAVAEACATAGGGRTG